jgi:hypothetical protein
VRVLKERPASIVQRLERDYTPVRPGWEKKKKKKFHDHKNKNKRERERIKKQKPRDDHCTKSGFWFGSENVGADFPIGLAGLLAGANLKRRSKSVGPRTVGTAASRQIFCVV